MPTNIATAGASDLPADRKLPANKLLWALIGFIALLLVGVFAFVTLRPIQVLPRITLAPGFSLLDQSGTQLTNEDLRGHLVLYNFSYTNCAAPCQTTSETMQALQTRLDELDAGGIPVRLVTISVDPERDTPEVLHAHAAALGADPAVWSFATGPAERLKWIIGAGFGVYYAPRDDGSIALDPAFMLVDGAGILRATYRTATPDVERILRDLGLIVEEVQNSEGAARYAYEAAHLFLCYPRG